MKFKKPSNNSKNHYDKLDETYKKNHKNNSSGKKNKIYERNIKKGELIS